ncbi:glycosyltransferase family 4 protein [Empedobacter sp.]|uniref:glycosyltransferase family 4 protein n=1 Tax=Empedobacter sp. TaxID=1927715 RepID=UPI002898B569|nr:glycosyltransferase family 4 protein [Empedobacter sp.]
MEPNNKVLFLTKYSSKGASSRYRSYNYEHYLIKNEIQPHFKPLLGDSYIKNLYAKKVKIAKLLAIYYVLKRIVFLNFYMRKYSHIVIESELFPHLPFGLDYYFLKKMKAFSLDFDDNIAANYVGSRNQDKIQKLMVLAKFVTVGNHWYKKEFKGNFIYLPTVVDLDNYPIFNINSKQPSIVWIGSPSTQKYLLLLEDVFVKVNKIIPFTLKIIGGDVRFSSEEIKVEYISWSAKIENKELSEATLGIMPLNDSYWEKGKCGFKLIQYMASGIPVVCSDLPANKEIVQEGINGFVVKSEKEWIDKLIFLLQNNNTKEMGLSGRKRIESNYSYQIWGDKYAEIIKKYSEFKI